MADPQQPPPPLELEGSSWQLVEIRDVADSVFVPNNPEDYLIRFRGESRMQIEADCNQAGATWSQAGTELSLSQFFSTRAMCPPPSLFNRYVMHLERVNAFEQSGERLILRSA
ncbi:MAG: META domain-containing protein, partial [Gammaproteobacteria bacterium]